MKEHLNLLDSIKDEISIFKERQAQGVASEEAREKELLREWLESKSNPADSKTQLLDSGTQQIGVHYVSHANLVYPLDIIETPNFVCASLSGSVWKVTAAIGEAILSAEQVVVILEAMKTEIKISAGEENVGLKVVGLAQGIREGSVVKAGDKLLYFE